MFAFIGSLGQPVGTQMQRDAKAFVTAHPLSQTGFVIVMLLFLSIFIVAAFVGRTPTRGASK
jgi:hypothetical protein